LELQHVFAAVQQLCFFAEQHPPATFAFAFAFAFETATPSAPASFACVFASRFAAATTYFGGVTPSRSAHASFAAWFMQQQSRQQASASTHPHAWCSHGKRSELTFTGVVGTGTPTAHAATAATTIVATTARRQSRRIFRVPDMTHRPAQADRQAKSDPRMPPYYGASRSIASNGPITAACGGARRHESICH
jgi:hypothetical protein